MACLERHAVYECTLLQQGAQLLQQLKEFIIPAELSPWQHPAGL